MTRKTLFLDVDGVVAGTSLGTMQDHWPDAETVLVNDNHVNLSKRMGEDLGMIVESVDVVWVTSWEHDSMGVAEYLGIPDSTYIRWMSEFYLPEHHTSSIPGKSAGIRKWLFEKGYKEPPDTLWVDDELLSSSGSTRSIISGASRLFLAPRPYSGLTPEDLEWLEKWSISG